MRFLHLIRLGAGELKRVVREWAGSREEFLEDVMAWCMVIAGAITVLATAATVLVDILNFHGVG